jgi:transposase-like protein
MTERLDLRHPPERRRAGVAAVKEHGSLRRAAAAVGVPKSTLHDWLRQEAGEPSPDAPSNPTQTLDVDQDPQASAALDEAEGALADEALAESEYPPPPQSAPPPSLLDHLSDPLYLRAFRRYVSAVANGTHPRYAAQVARAIHPDFDISEADNVRVVNAVGQLMMSEGGVEALLMAAVPPAYIRRVYDDFSMDAAAVGRLTDLLLPMRTEAYRVGINAQLTAMGRAPVAAVTDPLILASLREETVVTAQRIAETWNRDAASAVGARWLEVAPGSRMRTEGVPTPATREVYVRQAMTEWRDGRADWKAGLWASHQAGMAFNRGARDFVSRNPGAAQTGHVEPAGAECTGCVDLVNLGEQPAEIMMLTDLPLHPRCLVGEQPAQPVGVLMAASRVQYVGELLTVVTEAGRTMRVTPNHPVLTTDGWRPAQDLACGISVLTAVGAEPQNSLEAIFGSLHTRSITTMKAQPSDYHGDGRSMGEVQLAIPQLPPPQPAPDALPIAMVPDRIATVSCEVWSGQVYTLETSAGVFLADGVVVKNCEHYVVWSYSAWNDADGQLWAAQDDGESSGAGDDSEAA